MAYVWLTDLLVRRSKTERMESVSTRLDSETYRLIRETADERGVSMAEILRELIEKGRQYDALRAENERLQRQLTAANSRYEEHKELIEYVEEQREIERYRGRREQMLDQAGILTRWKWKLTGVPVDESESEEDSD